MHTLSKKFLSMLLTLAMVISLLPVNVLAAEEVSLDDVVEVEDLVVEETPVVEEEESLVPEEEEIPVVEEEETLIPEVTDDELIAEELESEGDSAMNASSGTCGDDLTWEITADGVLTISGTGAMKNFTYYGAVPWYAYKDSFTKVVITEGVTTVGTYAFENFTGVTEVVIESGLTTILNRAFIGCSGLQTITIPESVTEVGIYAFNGCSALTDVYYGGSESKWAKIEIGSDNTNLTNATIHYGKEDLGSGTCGTNLTWVLDADGVLTISGTGAMTDYVAYTAPWYSYYSKITAVEIESGVTSIGNNAFYGLSAMTSAEIPSGVKTIGECAFSNCSKLETAAIPEGVTSVGYCAFSSTKLTAVTIPASVTAIDGSAFSSCTALSEITVDEDSETFCAIDGVLYNADCSELVRYPAAKTDTDFEIPSGVTEIGIYAFSRCKNLKSVTIPAGVTSIGRYAFSNCTALTQLTIPTGIVTVEQYAFVNSTVLTDVYYGGNKTEWAAFVGITDSDELSAATVHYACGDNVYWTLSDTGVLTISGEGAMSNWAMQTTVPWYDERSSIVSVVIEDGVTSIGNNAFAYYTALKNVTIPTGVTRIGNDAFSGCTGLTKVTVPASVTTIGDYAFFKCENIKTLTISEGVQSIGYGAFQYCYGLQTVVLPESVTTIGENAFYGCTGMTEITIPVSVTTIGNSAFSACSALTNVYYGGSSNDWSKISMGSSVFYNPVQTDMTIHYAKEYIGGTCGDELTWELSDNGTLTISGTGAMTDYSSYSSVPWYEMRDDITSIVVESGVTTIGDYAFYFCRYMNGSVTLPEGITSIGKNAFYNCGGLTKISLPASLKSIDDEAFYKCSNLTSVTIPDGVTAINYGAFRNCLNLSSITIPDSVTSIGQYALRECTALTDIELPKNLETIGEGAFISCKALASVLIPKSVTAIGNEAFYGCDALTNVYYGADKSAWSAITIGTANDALTSATIHYTLATSGTCGDELTWELSDNGTLTISGTGPMDDYASMSKTPWYENKANITAVVIEEGVTSVGEYAFCSCSNLESVTVPTSVTTIGANAFAKTDKLTVTYSGTVEQWKALGYSGVAVSCTDGSAEYFGTCGENAKWEMKNGAMVISGTGPMTDFVASHYTNGRAPWYEYEDAITSVVIEEGITRVGNYSFYDCDELISVSLPAGLESIGEYNFCYNDKLTSVVIPDGVTSIEYDAFYNCVALESVSIPASVTSISNTAFVACAELTLTYAGTVEQWRATRCVVAPVVCTDGTVIQAGTCGTNVIWTLTDSGVLTISGSGAINHYGYVSSAAMAPWCEFSDSIKSVVIEEGITSIGDYAFYECSSFTEVTIPDSVTYINNYAFSGCTALTDVYYGGSRARWSAVTIGIVNTPLTSAAMHYGKVDTSGTCGDNLTWNFEDGVLTIEGTGEMTEYTDENPAPWADLADEITSVVIGEGVTTVTGSPFAGCDNLTDVTVQGDTVLGESVLEGCENLSALSGVCGENVTWELTNDAVLTIRGEGGMHSYADTAAPWANLGDSFISLVVDEGVTLIGREAFKDCTALETVDLPLSVTVIGADAFAGCTALTTVNYSGNVAHWADITMGVGNECLLNATINTIPEPTSAEAPVLVGTELGDGTIIVTWEDIPGVYAYRVYRKTPGSSAWKKCGEVTDNSYVDTVTKNGTYTYTVCALSSSGDTISKYDSKGIKAVYYAAPKISAVANTSTGVKLSWSKVSGISKYGVYLQTADGWQLIGTTSSASYTYKEAISGETYTLAVACMDKKGAVNYSTYRVAAPITFIAQPAISSIEVTDAGLLIRWDNVEGANAYRVLRKSSNKWKTVAETTDNSYLLESYKTGSSYTFSVVCIDKDTGATVSTYNKTGQTIKPVKAPTLKSIANAASGLKLTWGKVDGASKYRVLLKDGRDWVNVGETTSTSYTVKGLESGKIYDLTVCCISSNGIARASDYDTAGLSLYYLAAPEYVLSNVAGGIKLDWEPVSGADSYTVLRKSGSKWVVEAEGVTDTEYVYETASNKSYSFTIYSAANDGTKSGYSTTGKSLTYVAQPEIKSITGTTSGLKLTWGKVTGASKYRVYLVEDGVMTKLKDTTSTSFTYTAAENGRNYTFTVVCLNSKGKEVSSYDTDGWMARFVATPKLTALTNVTGGVQLTWEAVEGATAYQVMRKSGSTWVAEGEPVADTEYIYVDAVSGKSVTLSVRAIMGGDIGAYNTTGKSLTYITQPEIKSITGTTSGLKLTWSKVSGASKYRVYLVEDGVMTKLKDTTSTSYTYTKAENGRNYTFTVVCLNSKSKEVSAYDAAGWSARFVATPKLTALTNVETGVQLTWEAVEGATAYQVMRKSGSTWVAEGEPVTDTEYVYADAVSGKSVTLSVRAIMGEDIGAYNTTGKTVTYIAQPDVYLTETASGVKISWDKVGGAAKYRVALVNDDGSLTTLKDTTSTSYTYTKIEEGKSYRFTVACLNSNGKIIGTYNTEGWEYARPLPTIISLELQYVGNTISSFTGAVGEKVDLTLSYEPSDIVVASDDVIWISEDESIAVVVGDNSGCTITCISSGTTSVTVALYNQTFTVNVTVRESW